MSTWRLCLLTIAVSLILANGIAIADVPYTLTPGSTYQQGCVGRCMCPVLQPEAITGTFLLVPGISPTFAATKSGFAMIWNYSTLSLGDHSIKVRVENQDGQTKDMDALVTVRKARGGFSKK